MQRMSRICLLLLLTSGTQQKLQKKIPFSFPISMLTRHSNVTMVRFAFFWLDYIMSALQHHGQQHNLTVSVSAREDLHTHLHFNLAHSELSNQDQGQRLSTLCYCRGTAVPSRAGCMQIHCKFHNIFEKGFSSGHKSFS